MAMKYSLNFRVANFLRSKGYNFREHLSPEVINMQSEIAKLDGGINFKVELYPDGAWTAISTNVDGLVTGGSKQSEINELLKDATFTYYGVPPKYSNDKMLRNTGEPITVEQTVHVTA